MPTTFIVACSALAAAAIGLFIVPYSEGYGFVPVPLWSTLSSIWRAPEFEDWQHGMIVPFISIGLLWFERKRIAAAPIKPANIGLVPIIVALAAYWFGLRAGTHYMGWFSVQLLLGGGILWLFGWRFFGAVFFPWAFLVFAWPLPFLTETIAVPLRHLMAGLSSGFLNLVGVATLKAGTSLHSAAQYAADGSLLKPAGELFKLDVADPCSGIRSLFAILMVSAIFGYLTLPKWWQRIALIVCSIPLVVMGNFVRMLMLTFGVMWFGEKFALGEGLHKESWYHISAGFAVFIVALLGMMGIQKLIERAPEKFSDLLIRDDDEQVESDEPVDQSGKPKPAQSKNQDAY
jgi:exosortase